MNRLPSTTACLLTSALALAACSPEVRSFSGDGGSATSTTTGSTTGGTGGSGTTTSTGGTGGSVMASCTPSGGVFDILNANDFGTDEIDDKPLLVPGTTGGNGQVHVLVHNRTSNLVIIRSIIDNPNPLGNTLTLGMTGTSGYEYATGWVDSGGLHVAGGSSDLGLGSVRFALDPGTGVQDGPVFSSLETPPECIMSGGAGGLRHVRMSQVNGQISYVAVCTSPTLPPGKNRVLFASDSGAPPVQVATGSDTDLLMNPAHIASVNGKILAFYSGDFGPVGVSYGSAPELGNPIPFSLDATPGIISVIFGLVPLPSGNGVGILGASVDQNLTQGSLWAGALGPSELGAIGQTPPPGMKKVFTSNDITEFGGLSQPTYDKDSIVTAGASIVMDGVYFSWFKRDTTPLVLEQPIIKSDGSYSIIAAAAAPLGNLMKLVVWIERDGSSPPHYTVRGRKLLCMGGN